MDKRKTFYDKCFKDKEGNLALTAQANLPIIVAVVFAVPALFIKDGIIGILLNLLAFGAFFTWAWLELFDGVNYFRRALGTVVLVVVLTVAILRVYTYV